MKKFFNVMLAFLLLTGLCENHVYANEINYENPEIIEEIDGLYQKRNELSLHFEDNEFQIQLIDEQLKKLGVEEIPLEEVVQLFSERKLNLGYPYVGW